MKNVLIAALLIALLTFTVRAQGPTAVTFQGLGPHTTCLSPAAGQYMLCVATDGVWVSNNGLAYFMLTTPAASGVQKVQGAIPGPTGNVQLTCTFPSTAATFSAGTSTQAMFGTLNIPCTGQGN